MVFFPTLLENQSQELYRKYLDWSMKFKIKHGDPILITKMELGIMIYLTTLNTFIHLMS